jgi:peptide/nickel transport system substrate-binding protein
MRKNSLALFFIFAFLTSILSFCGMMYYSLVIQEEKLGSIERILHDILHTKEKTPAPATQSLQTSHMPNLLGVDLFLEKTLPQLLPSHFTPKGALRMATLGAPQNLHPFSQWAAVDEWTAYCQGSLGRQSVGFYDKLATSFATRIEKKAAKDQQKEQFWIYLRQDVFWEPLEARFFPERITLAPHFLQRHQVTAYDFLFYWEAISNPHVEGAGAVTLRFLLQDIENVEVKDDFTFVITAKKAFFQGKYRLGFTIPFYIAAMRPLARFVYQYGADGTKFCPEDSQPYFYKTSSLWAEKFATHFASRVIVSCGPWIFDGFDESGIQFRRNPQFYTQDEALYEGMRIDFLETQDAIFRDFIAEKIDLCMLSPESMLEYTKYLASGVYEKQKKTGHAIQHLEFLQRQYTYIGWNERRPFFTSKKVRQALSLAIDRPRLIHQVLHGYAVAVTGPFGVDSEYYNKNIPLSPYDPAKAKQLLAEEGWFDSNGDGIIDKEGVDFRFSLTYFVKNKSSKACCELVASFLKEVGIKCELLGLDLADLSSAFDNKTFDAIFLSWMMSTTPEDPRQLWHSEGAFIKGSSNMVGFQNKEVDALIEKLQYEDVKEKRKALFWKLHEKLADEQPYAFLFTPKTTLLWWNTLHNIFIPKMRQDLIPKATVMQPEINYSWKTA